MMIAAIYARKSTEQHGADADAKSVDRQIDNARAFAATKGWRVSEAHVYADDAISGAETRKLVNRQRLLDAISAGPPFQVLIMRDDSRFSREDGEVAVAELKRIAQAGTAVWFYQDGKPFTFGTFGENVVSFVRAEMNAEFRRQIGKWTREAMVRKAQAGHVCGGKVFGYDNVKVDGHVERRINEPQAAVVRQIFALSATGTGYTRIAKQLNAEGATAPRPQQRRPSGWSPSSVNEVLHRELYRGLVVWNKTKKRDAEGKTAASARPEAEWLRREQPELRIVSDDVWSATRARLGGIRAHLLKASGGRSGARARDIESQYLLSGFARCAVCGGSLGVLSRSHGGARAFFYGCIAYHKRGTSVCGNALQVPMAHVDEAVLDALKIDVLRPAVVMAIVDGVLAALAPKARLKDATRDRAELQGLKREIDRLIEAVATGGQLAPLLEALTVRQQRHDELAAALAVRESVERLVFDRLVIDRSIHAHLANWRTLLTRHITNGRQLLREVLAGPLRFTPDGKTYRFEGEASIGGLLAGVAGLPTFVASPTGTAKGCTIAFAGKAA